MCSLVQAHLLLQGQMAAKHQKSAEKREGLVSLFSSLSERHPKDATATVSQDPLIVV